MTFTRPALVGLITAAVLGTTVFAASHVDVTPAIKARKSHMQLFAFNLGILGNMAKGSTEFDAEAAKAAADDIAILAGMNIDAYWPMGSSTADVADTRALPAIWEEGSDLGAKLAAVKAAAETMASAADSLEGVQANMGALGSACGACHQAYRQTN